MVERNDLPALAGTYAMVLRFSKRLEFVVGRLGVFQTQPGYYVYVGSALEPGGLAARVGRHCRSEKSLRWYIDYLRSVAQIEEVWYATGKSRHECRWASVLQALPGASVPLARFGASDCTCPSHLHFFNVPPSLAGFRRKLRTQRIKRLGLDNGKRVSIGVGSAQGLQPRGTQR